MNSSNVYLSYFLQSGSDNFTVDAITGELRTAAVLDYETGPITYVHTIRAQDGGSFHYHLYVLCHINVNICV